MSETRDSSEVSALDIQNMNLYAAQAAIEKALKEAQAEGAVFLRVVHGKRNALQRMVQNDYLCNPRVVRMALSADGTYTDLVL